MKKIILCVLLLLSINSAQALDSYIIEGTYFYPNSPYSSGPYDFFYRDQWVVGAVYDVENSQVNTPFPDSRYFDLNVEMTELATSNLLSSEPVNYSAIWTFDMLENAFSITAADVVCTTLSGGNAGDICPFMAEGQMVSADYDGSTFEFTVFSNYSPGFDISAQLSLFYTPECGEYCTLYYPSIYPTPLPAAAWLFGAALLGLIGLKSRRQT